MIATQVSIEEVIQSIVDNRLCEHDYAPEEVSRRLSKLSDSALLLLLKQSDRSSTDYDGEYMPPDCSVFYEALARQSLVGNDLVLSLVRRFKGCAYAPPRFWCDEYGSLVMSWRPDYFET